MSKITVDTDKKAAAKAPHNIAVSINTIKARLHLNIIRR